MSAAAKKTNDPDSLAGMMDVLAKAGRTNFIKDNAWESALCALILALQPLGKVYKLLEALPHGSKPFDEVAVLNAIAHLGYAAHKIDLKIHMVDARLLPCLFVTRTGEPIVLLERKDRNFKLYRQGELCEIPASDLAGCRGRAWMFEIFDENKAVTSKFMRRGSGYGWFRTLSTRFKGTFAQILTAGLILNLIALTTPIFIMLVYDRVIASGSLATMPMLLLGACLAIAFEWRLRTVRARGLSWIASRMDNLVSNKIFCHLIELPPNLVEHASVSAQIARIKTFESVRDFFSGSVFLSVLEMPFVVISVLAIAAMAGPLAWVPVLMLSAYGILFWLAYRKIRISIRLAAKASSARQQFMIETFEKIRGIRGYGLTGKWQEKFRDLSGREMTAHFHLNWLGMVAETCAHTLTLVSAVATVTAGVHLIWAGAITTGALVASMILVWKILTPFYGICSMIPRLEQLRNSIAQVDKLMDLDTEAMTARNVSRLPSLRGQISFNDVTLRYGGENGQVFSHLTFSAAPGDLIAVTGENGSGKTSLLKMIKAMHNPENGSILIDGFDMRQLDAPDLRRQIAYVPQQHNFFEGSIVDNMRMANPLADEDSVKSALEAADAWSEISSLPRKLDTAIGRYGGENLSASLLMRLSLARMYLHPASIVLIDEIPNSLLSGRAGRNLKDYLASIKGMRTVFLVTYREDFMRMSDAVIDLRRGAAAAIGTHKTVIQTLSEQAA